MLEKISFEVAEGEFCVLLGPSGCGKSTLLRMIAGLEESSSGTISLGSRRIDGLAPRERDIAFATAQSFTPALSLDLPSLIFAILGIVVGWLLWGCIKAPARLLRRKKQHIEQT